MNNNFLVSPITLSPSEKIAVERLGSSIGSCIESLNFMEGSFVQNIASDDQRLWCFKHPTIGDAYASIVIRNPELLEIYVRGTSTQKLTEQITCGDVGLEKAIIIPKSMYNHIVERLSDFKESERYKTSYLSSWYATRNLHNFLATRCSHDFLKLYTKDNPTIFNEISAPGLSLSVSSEVDLAIKLHEFGLLPEDYRKKFVKNVTDYATSGQDLYSLINDKFKIIFTEKELAHLKRQVRESLVPNLREARYSWESNFSSYSDGASEHMEGFVEILDTLAREFKNSHKIIELIDQQRAAVEEWIEENSEEGPRRRSDRELGDTSTGLQKFSSRSIFDDIDD